MSSHNKSAIIIGGGIAGLTTACLLTKSGLSCTVLEQNWLPGGCATSYPRKHYIFESGATTLVGLDDYMPLNHLLNELDIQLKPQKLKLPMKVYLKSGKVLFRYQDLDQWIEEAERVFGPKGQRPFWELCYQISQSVWKTSLQQRNFPPTRFKDFVQAIKNFRLPQMAIIPSAFRSMLDLLKKYGLDQCEEFVSFVDEQLMITAQNHMEEVNVLFGATALCYTNYSNYYMNGGLIELVKPLVTYLEQNGSEVRLREGVSQVIKKGYRYEVRTKKHTYASPYLVSAIPLNNTLELFEQDKTIRKKYESKLLRSEALNSAFQVSFVATKKKRFDCLHHQIHLEEPLPYTQSSSIFLSLSHPDDVQRCGKDEFVGSVSTHVPHPEKTFIDKKEELVDIIFDTLENRGFLTRKDIIFHHSSTPKAWKKWTGRSWGFVGGYPQYMDIKPWNMIDARLDRQGAYICGDSTYPGQGIPGACLSGIIAFEKMKTDGVLA